MSRWSERADVARGHDYDLRWKRLADAGESIHGEADLVESLLGGCAGRSVLDAGCGTGRVAIELARRGADVVGVDLDPAMLAAAREKAPGLRWIRGDLCDFDACEDRPWPFDAIVLAGNVMIFVAPGSEQRVVANLAGMLAPDGLLVAGFQLKAGRAGVERYDRWADAAGLELRHRWATWDREPFAAASADGSGPGAAGYAVSVHSPRDTLA